MLHKYLMFKLKILHLKCIATLNFPKKCAYLYMCIHDKSYEFYDSYDDDYR